MHRCADAALSRPVQYGRPGIAPMKPGEIERQATLVDIGSKDIDPAALGQVPRFPIASGVL